jgi:hypothetical protein
MKFQKFWSTECQTKPYSDLYCSEELYNFSPSLVQEDEDGHLVVLQIIQDLMTKAQDIFLDHFARLGVFSKVLQLAGPQDTQESQSNKKDDNVSHHMYNV